MFWGNNSRCNKRFPTTAQRERHWRDALGPVRNCDVCGKSFPTNRNYQLKEHIEKHHQAGGRSSMVTPPCSKEAPKSWKETETLRSLPYPFPSSINMPEGSAMATPAPDRIYTATQTADEKLTEPAITKQGETVICLPESASVNPLDHVETAAPLFPLQIDEQDFEIPAQTMDQTRLFPLRSRRHERMMLLRKSTTPLDPIEPPVGRLYENLQSDPRVFFPGAPSSYHTGIAADVLRPLRDRAIEGCNRAVRHVPEGVAIIRRSERAYLSRGEVYELNTSFLLDSTYRIRVETSIMTDRAFSRQTVDTGVQCEIINSDLS